MHSKIQLIIDSQTDIRLLSVKNMKHANHPTNLNSVYLKLKIVDLTTNSDHNFHPIWL
jgi:hypothetical protein